MTGVLRVKAGVAFTTIAPAGFRILSALERTARAMGLDLTVTSACDGAHSGPTDPHKLGEAYDIRSHGLTGEQKGDVLVAILTDLADHGEHLERDVVGYWLASTHFYGFLEAVGTENEHWHVQRRHGTTYPSEPVIGVRA